jgi:hypothetical protein
MTKRYFILLYNKIDMKMRIPNISRRVNYQIITLFILLVVVIFITAMPWASNTFHEALENISNTPTPPPLNGTVKDKVQTSVASVSANGTKPKDDISSALTNIKNISIGTTPTPTPTTTTEGFVSDYLFQNSPTSFPGYPVDTTNWSPVSDIAELESAPLDKNSLYMFNNARFSPNCCAKGPGSSMSSSMGCVCLTNNDAYYITEGRGGGNMNPSAII